MTNVLVQSEPREAQERAARIRAGIGSYLATLADISTAYAQRDWDALGYADWQAYVDGEYSEHRLKLSPEHRQKAVAELRLAGLSQRAIGTTLGISAATVNRDLGTVADETVPDRITGLDGREQPSTRPSPPIGADAPTSRGETRPGRSEPTPGGVEPERRNSSQSNLPDNDSTFPGNHPTATSGAGAQLATSGDADAAGRPSDVRTVGPDRTRPPTWDPEDRRLHEADVRRAQDIEAARHTAQTIVPEFLSAVSTIVAGSRFGEPNLVTKQLITDLRKGIALLEGEL